MDRLARSILTIVCFMLLAFSAVGCAKWPPSITTRLDQSLSQPGSGLPFVEVHLVGVTASEYQTWNTMSMGNYWAANGPSRQAQARRYVVRLTPENPSKTISKDDAIWEKWSDPSVAYLMVLADLPNVRAGGPDPRRASIPLDREHKQYPPQITVTIGRDGIQVSPSPEEKHGMF